MPGINFTDLDRQAEDIMRQIKAELENLDITQNEEYKIMQFLKGLGSIIGGVGTGFSKIFGSIGNIKNIFNSK